MKSCTSIRVGTYTLTPDLTLGIRASDDGTVVTVNHKPTGLNAVAVINEHGAIVRRQTAPQASLRFSTADSEPSSELPVPFDDDRGDSRIEILGKPRSLPSATKGKRKPKLIRFTLLFDAKCHPKSRPHALVGYTDGDSGVTHVLYRSSGGRSGGHTDRHMRIADGRIWIASQIKSSERVTKAEWAEILAMPEHTSFQLVGHLPMWRKMSVEELRARMEEQTFQVIAERSISVQPPVVPAVRPSTDLPKYKTKHVSVMHCEPANFDHSNGAPATAITLCHKDMLEPVLIDLADTKKLIVNLLISLWTADDALAEEVLAKFPMDDGGIHYWPKQE